MRYFVPFLVLVLLLTNCNKVEDETGFIEPPIELTESEMLLTPVRALINPNGITPLAAELSFQSLEPTTVEIAIDGSIPVSFKIEAPSNNHQFPLVGLYPDSNNLVFLKITNPEGQYFRDTLQIQTPPLPNHFPDIEITTAHTAFMEPGMTLSEFNVGTDSKLQTQPFLFDREGIIRWFINLDFTGSWTAPLQKLANGNLVFGHAHTIYEVDWLGKEINKWHHWGFFQHHDLIELPNGNFIIPVSEEDIGTGLDQIIELDRQSGDIIRQWDLRAVLDIDRFDLLWQSYDWVHVNSVWYDEEDGGLIISGRNQAVFKVSKDNELVWIIGGHQGWGQAGQNGDGPPTSDYLLTALDETGQAFPNNVQQGTADAPNFSWSWGQHAASLLPNGHVLIFDNGWRRNFEHAGQNGFSRAVEYKVDAENKTIQQVWQYGKERGTSTFSQNISNVQYLPESGNLLFCPGNIQQPGFVGAKIIEVSYPSGNVLFEANVLFKNAQSTGSGWGSSDLIYRSKRVVIGG